MLETGPGTRDPGPGRQLPGQRLLKSQEHLTHALAQFQSSSGRFPFTQTQLYREQELGLQFGARALCYRNKPRVIARAVARVAFGDVGWDRHRTSLQLRGQTISLFPWELTRDLVDMFSQLHGNPPHLQ